MHQQDQRNPHLADMFKTAIARAQAPITQPPQVVVTGNHNVISWGGTVYMGDRGECVDVANGAEFRK